MAGKQERISAAEYNARVAAAKPRGHASDRYNQASRGRREDLGGIYFRSKSDLDIRIMWHYIT